MNSYSALLKKFYTSFWTRNIVIIFIAITFSLINNSFQLPENKINTLSLLFLGISNIGFIIFYNHILLRLLLFRKKYVLFFMSFVVYTSLLTLFIMHVTRRLLHKSFISDYLVFIPDVVFNTILISSFYFFHYHFMKYIGSNENKDTSEKKKLLDEKELDQEKTKLVNFLNTEKPYLNCDLNLIQLANSLSVKPHVLSYVINEGFDENFNQFINGYRIEEAKKLIINPNMNHLSILGIGFEVGFNSKSAFNSTFKKNTGMTPNQFKNDNLSSETSAEL